jgi:hypothetical protein
MVVDRPHVAAGPLAVRGIHRSEGRHSMIILIAIGLLALFSLISYLLGTDEPRQANVDPVHQSWYLMRFGAR